MPLTLEEAAARYCEADRAWTPLKFTAHFLRPAHYRALCDAEATLADLMRVAGVREVAHSNRIYRLNDVGRVETLVVESPDGPEG